MRPADALEAADLNYQEFNRHAARATPGGTVHEEAGVLLYAPGHRFPFGANGAMRTDRRTGAEEAVARAREHFAARKRGFTFCLMQHRDADLAGALERAGIGRFSDSPGMMLDAPLPAASAPAGATIEAVADGDGVREYGVVCGEAYSTYGMPPAVGVRQFADDAMILQPQVAAFLARVDGEAVAAAMVMVSHGVAGIYWVGTRPAARGRGLAEACTRAAVAAGFDLGARVAALQASVMGAPIYARMGFREVTRYPWYVVSD